MNNIIYIVKKKVNEKINPKINPQINQLIKTGKIAYMWYSI